MPRTPQRTLPPRPSLENLRKQAKRRLREEKAAGRAVSLQQVQHALAREYGCASWAELTRVAMPEAAPADRLVRFLGSPVPLPEDLDPRYGARAMHAFLSGLFAARGLPVLALAADETEYPVVVAGAVQTDMDYPQLREAIAAAGEPAYEYSWCASTRLSGGRFVFAISLMPSQLWHSSPQYNAIRRRLMPRLDLLEEELLQKIAG